MMDALVLDLDLMSSGFAQRVQVSMQILAMRCASPRLIGSMISGHERECYALCLSKDSTLCNRELLSCCS